MRTLRSTLLILLLAPAAGCGDEKPAPAPTPGGTGAATPPAEADGLDVRAVRERVAAHVAADEKSRAREALRPLVERRDPAVVDLLAGAAIEFMDNRLDACTAFLDRAAQLEPGNAGVLYLRGQVARNSGEMEAARAAFRAALAAAPDDLATKLSLSEAEYEFDDVARAEALLREILAAGPANGGAWYVAALYRLRVLLTGAGREDEAARLDPVIRTIEARGIQPPGPIQVGLGELARVRAPVPSGSTTRPTEAAIEFVARPDFALPDGASWIAARDVDGDGRPDLAVRAADALAVHLNLGSGFAAPAEVLRGKCAAPVFFDVDNDGDLDVFSLRPEGPELRVRAADGTYAAAPARFPEFMPGVTAVIATDYDHEGDLDLVLAGSFGVRVWRNDAVLDRSKEGVVTLKEARFADASADAGLPTSGEHVWIVAEDFDGDNDVDLLVRGPSGVVVLDSLRDGKFAPVRGTFDVPASAEGEPLVADFDGDARPDLWFPGAPSTLVLQGRAPAARAEARATPGSVAAVDLDLDGALDVVWLDQAAGRLRGILALGLASERALATGGAGAAGDRVVVGDFDGDCRNDVAIESAGRVTVLVNASKTGTGARLAWTGSRDNRRAVGAICEVRAGAIYRRTYWRGEPEVLGLGGARTIDVLRITWPNGVQTTRLDVAVDACNLALDPDEALQVLTQQSGQIGSCPFLYTWNGRTYEFITDVLGITPLGLRMAPGMFVPPDHDEYVLVRGEQLAEKDGAYEVQVTEELREVTYLDHARLLVVDAPAGTEIYPNERFQFPPFPVHRIHALSDPILPRRATGSDGRDCTGELAAADDRFPEPMELHPPQFAGLCKPWFVELEFDPARIPAEGELRLALTGWFYWSDASANMAAARSQGVEFVPPRFQVPDGSGGWRDATPPVGFPAGKTKTMIVDVAAFLDRRDPRVRVATTLRLYWDRIALFAGADAPVDVREIPVSKAVSWRRGFSAPLDGVPEGAAHPANRPERFDWDVLAAEPRWNQHPGLYTRHGDVTELVTAVDDRFVILGAGDALAISFSAAGVTPPAAGKRRDFLLYLDGWAKDRDPNTIEALEVEPLPFHGMSGYPYRADERFPDTAAHQEWQRAWRTRPAHTWIAPVSPRREVEAVLGAR